MKELTYPSNILDLMAVCWSRDPDDRPSANEIELFASKPEFCSIQNAVAVSDERVSVICACSVLREPHSNIHGTPLLTFSSKITDSCCSVDAILVLLLIDVSASILLTEQYVLIDMAWAANYASGVMGSYSLSAAWRLDESQNVCS